MATNLSQTRAEADRSFERLYEGHRVEVYRAALRQLGNAADAEDVTQAAFVDAYRALLRGLEPTAPRAWLLAIAENVRRRRFRTALRRPREEPLDAAIAASAERSDEQANAIRSALDALPPQQREVFVLREITGLSYDEIAERVDSTVASVQMLLFRARQTLRDELDPPSVAKRRRALGLQLPPWLAHLAGRIDPSAVAPRGAGAIGAAVLAATGITAGALHVKPQDGKPSGRVLHEQLRPEAAPTAVSATAPLSWAPRAGAPTQRPAAEAETKRPGAGRSIILRPGRVAQPAEQPSVRPSAPAVSMPSTAHVPAAEPAAEPEAAIPAPGPAQVAATRTPVAPPSIVAPSRTPLPPLPTLATPVPQPSVVTVPRVVVPEPPAVLPVPPVTVPVAPVGVLPALPVGVPEPPVGVPERPAVLPVPPVALPGPPIPTLP